MTNIATKWQEVICRVCGQLLTDRANAVIANDPTTGGLVGRHTKCPPKAESPAPDASIPVPEPDVVVAEAAPADVDAGAPAASPGPQIDPQYQQGWDDCFARVQKVLGENFPIPVKS